MCLLVSVTQHALQYLLFAVKILKGVPNIESTQLELERSAKVPQFVAPKARATGSCVCEEFVACTNSGKYHISCHEVEALNRNQVSYLQRSHLVAYLQSLHCVAFWFGLSLGPMLAIVLSADHYPSTTLRIAEIHTVA